MDMCVDVEGIRPPPQRCSHPTTTSWVDCVSPGRPWTLCCQGTFGSSNCLAKNLLQSLLMMFNLHHVVLHGMSIKLASIGTAQSAPVWVVGDGMQVVDKFYAGYGEQPQQ
eukprot:3091020-Amphidinium_carterae.1